MGVDGRAAARALLANGAIRGGYCLYYVWLAYAAVGASTGRGAGTALEGWKKSDGKHEGDRNPPAGVPVWFGAKPSSDAGDVVISLGGGRVACTDWPRYGVVGTCTIDERQQQIGRPYLGWTERIFDQPIDYANAPAPASGGNATPIQKEWDEMATEQQVRDIFADEIRKARLNDRFIVSYASQSDRNGIVVAGFGYWHKLTGEEWEHFNWLRSNAGRTIFSGMEIFTPINDRSYDILRDVCLNDGVAEGEGVDYETIRGFIESAKATPVDLTAVR